jgi:hypothetical protein
MAHPLVEDDQNVIESEVIPNDTGDSIALFE